MRRLLLACGILAVVLAGCPRPGDPPAAAPAAPAVPAAGAAGAAEVRVALDAASYTATVGKPVFMMADTAEVAGQPDAPLTYAWTATGPGTAVFAPPGGARTNATFGSLGEYRVTLTVSGAGASASTAATVTVGAPRSLALVSPLGGETLTPGQEVRIRWQAHEVKDIKLLFSPDGGATWSELVNSMDDRNPQWGDYPWTVPDITSSACIIMLRAYIGESFYPSKPFAIRGTGPEIVPAEVRTVKPEGTLAEAAALLGSEAAGARIVAQRGGRLVRIDVASGEQRTIAEVPAEAADGYSRPWWSHDGRRVVWAHAGKAWVGGDGPPERILPGAAQVEDPSWWRDPATGADWVVYATSGGKFHLAERDRPHGATVRAGPGGEVVPLAGIPCDGGLSPDGRVLGEAYGDAVLASVGDGRIWQLNDGQQACNGSISPDGTHRLMHLALPHDWFQIRDRFDRRLWRIEIPPPAEEWQTPRWSNHPDWAMATLRYSGAYYLALVRISDQRIAVLGDLGSGWRVPHLWLPGGAAAGAAQSSEDASWAALPPAEAAARGRAELARLAAVADPRERRGGLRALAERLAGTAVAAEAAARLDDPALARALAASALAAEIEALSRQLVAVPGAAARWDDARWRARNATAVGRIAPLLRRLAAEHPGSHALAEAGAIAERYALPRESAGDPAATGELTVEAELEAVSRMHAFHEIKPYREEVVLLRYRVLRVVAGAYAEPLIVVGHWGLYDAAPTAVALWRPGLRQTLRVRPLAALPDLDQQQRSGDAAPDELEPYWALAVDGAATPAPPPRR